MPPRVGRLPLRYPVSPTDPPLGFPLAAHEPGPTRPYRATWGESSSPSGPARRACHTTGLAGGQIRLSLEPGQKGTRRVLAKYGERLVCVPYRYDPARKKRFKTVEIVVDERDWLPPPPCRAADQVVGVHVAFEEVELRRQVKPAGRGTRSDVSGNCATPKRSRPV